MRRKLVALLIEQSNAYARGLLEGINGYAQQHENWSICLPEQVRGASPPSWLENWKGDGIIARIESNAMADAIRKKGAPVIDVSAARLVESVPWVETNDEQIASLAAEHLIEKGFRHFAFCGDQAFNWSTWRCEHFVKMIEASQFECGVFCGTISNPEQSWMDERIELAKWVQALPKPIGIMCCFDIKAQQLLDICREQSISVPEEVAVIGVDNDRLLCDLSTPSLTSVIPDTHQTGYVAAQLLDQVMSGQEIAPVAHLIKPLGVESRQSTDILAIKDQDIAAAVRLIRENACAGITIAEILKRVPISRRMLESRFKKIVGRSPHQEICRIKIAQVKRLLVETDQSIREIAWKTGFEHAEYLSVAFKRTVGVTPKGFRLSERASSSAST